MRRKIIAGNWKMNLDWQEAMELGNRIAGEVDDTTKAEIILATPFLYIPVLSELTEEQPKVALAAQNCSQFRQGAYTGEVSASMLRSAGAKYIIVGHSERRKYFHETNDVLAEKVKRVLENDLQPIYCCGETLDERNSTAHFDVVKTQLETGLFHLNDDGIDKCIIAYEPVWAIGTGVTASPEQAQEMHHFIRELVKSKYGDHLSGKISILYGGSVTPENAALLFKCPDVDGGLVGGASLKAIEFGEIIEAMN